MIGYINEHNEVVQLRQTIDADRTPTIKLYSLTELHCDNQKVSIAQSGDTYECNLSALSDDTIITFSNETDSVGLTVHASGVDTAYLKHWLTMQQMPELIAIFEGIGWHKLKETALKARQIMLMQGTEQALQMMLELVEADKNVQLYRYWSKHNELEDSKAFDDLVATDLADIGYALTGGLKLVYKEDTLNPWSDTISDNIKSMIVTLDQLVQCIRKVLPVTLRIEDYELIRVGLGMIQMSFSTGRHSLQTSKSVIDAAISIDDVLQYSQECYVYDTQTFELIRLADASDIHATGDYRCVLGVHVDKPVYDFCIHIGDIVLTAPVIETSKYFCIQPPVGTYDVEYCYTSQTGNRFVKTKHIRVIKSCSRQNIYELADNTYELNNTAMQIEEGNITNFIRQWMYVSETCNGRPISFAMPKPYQVFYSYDAVEAIRITDADGVTKVYEGDRLACTDKRFTARLVDVHRTSRQFGNGYNIVGELMTCEPAGKYDYVVEYNHAGTWWPMNQLTKYLSCTVEPMWNVNDIRTLMHMAGARQTVKLKVGDSYANHGAYMPVTIDDKFIKRLSMTDNVACNVGPNGELISISTIANEANLTAEFVKSASIRQVRRPASFALKPMQVCNESVPYVAYRPHTWIELIRNGHVTAKAYGLLVFAKYTSGKYTLHLHNDWYDKTIEL